MGVWFNIFEATAGTDTLVAKAAVQEARNESDNVAHAEAVDIL